MSTIFLRLPLLRAERRLSQRQLAALAGIRPDTISALERGDTTGIHFSTLARLCEVLHCLPGDILGLEGQAGHQPPTLGGPDEDVIITQRLHDLDHDQHVDGPTFLAALIERAEVTTAPSK